MSTCAFKEIRDSGAWRFATALRAALGEARP